MCLDWTIYTSMTVNGAWVFELIPDVEHAFDASTSPEHASEKWVAPDPDPGTQYKLPHSAFGAYNSSSYIIYRHHW